MAGLGLPTQVTELVGDYPSPSVLIDGVDVMGATGDSGPACRLDLPTAEVLGSALSRAMTNEAAAANQSVLQTRPARSRPPC
jgi:hypothetical protein